MRGEFLTKGMMGAVLAVSLCGGTLAQANPTAPQTAPQTTAATEILPKAQFDTLWARLDIDTALDIMRVEGLMMANDIARDYLPAAHGDGWQLAVDQIYDLSKMQSIMREVLQKDLVGADVDVMLAFFDDPLGARIVELESSARRAFLDPDTEEAARDRVRGGDIDDSRTALIGDFIDVNDLVDLNTSGSMNTNYHFYVGLSESEVFEMSEQEILRQVWDQAQEGEADTREWLMAYLGLAYAGLSDDELQSYIDFSATPAGQRLNRALFAGFGVMYDQQYHALGLAVADQLSGQDL